MSRSRSPGYPNFSLPAALERVRDVFEADRQNAIDRGTIAKHIGYSGISGASDKAIATLVHYGLLERAGKGEMRVTALAVDILHPEDLAGKTSALKRAARNPKLFAQLYEKFDGAPSADALESYLKRENFLERAIRPVSSAYLDTCSYLEQEGASDFSFPSDGNDEELASHDEEPYQMELQTQQQAPTAPPSPPSTSSDEPIYTISGGRIALGGAITNKKQADEVVKLINAVRDMLPEAEPEVEESAPLN